MPSSKSGNETGSDRGEALEDGTVVPITEEQLPALQELLLGPNSWEVVELGQLGGFQPN